MYQHMHVKYHAYANKIRCMYVRNVCQLSNPVIGMPVFQKTLQVFFSCEHDVLHVYF